jgi:hypothetical protein
MDETAGRATRRAVLRALPTPTDVEVDGRFVDVDPPLLDVVDALHAPPSPRAPELEALLREVDDLRSTMRRDLGLAATAAEAGADDLAGWLLLGSDGAVRRFEDNAQAHLAAAELAERAEELPAVPAPRRRARLLPAAPVVAAAAALLGFLTGVVPGSLGDGVSSPETSNTAALDSYAQLTRLATSGASASSISAAAARFHADLAPLVAAASTDPAAAEKAIALLQSEHAVITSEGDSAALRAVLAQADALVRTLQARLPKHRLRVPSAAPLPQPQDQPRQQAQQPAQQPTQQPAAKSSPSPSSKPSPKPSPSPSATPRTSPSPDSGPLPQSPYTLPG